MVSKGEVVVAQGGCRPGHFLYRAAAIGPVGMAVQVALELAEELPRRLGQASQGALFSGRVGTPAPTRPGTRRRRSPSSA